MPPYKLEFEEPPNFRRHCLSHCDVQKKNRERKKETLKNVNKNLIFYNATITKPFTGVPSQKAQGCIMPY